MFLPSMCSLLLQREARYKQLMAATALAAKKKEEEERRLKTLREWEVKHALVSLVAFFIVIKIKHKIYQMLYK